MLPNGRTIYGIRDKKDRCVVKDTRAGNGESCSRRKPVPPMTSIDFVELIQARRSTTPDVQGNARTESRRLMKPTSVRGMACSRTMRKFRRPVCQERHDRTSQALPIPNVAQTQTLIVDSLPLPLRSYT